MAEYGSTDWAGHCDEVHVVVWVVRVGDEVGSCHAYWYLYVLLACDSTESCIKFVTVAAEA